MRWHSERPSPTPGAGGLGGEEWIEDALEMLARDSDTVVDDLDEHATRFVVGLSGALVFGDTLMTAPSAGAASAALKSRLSSTC